MDKFQLMILALSYCDIFLMRAIKLRCINPHNYFV